MTLIFAWLFAINVLLVALLVRHSRSPRFHRLAGSAVNPLFIFCLLSILFNIDFIVVWNNPSIEFLEDAASLSQQTVLEAYATYTFLFVGAALGCMAALHVSPRRGPDARPYALALPDPAATRSAEIMFAAALALSIPTLLWFDFHPPQENLSYQVVGREAPVLGLATWLIPVAAVLFVAYQPRPFSARGASMLAVAVVVMAMSGGARGPVLLLLLIIGVAYASSKRISVLWCALIIPAAALFLVMSGYFFRETGNYGSFGDFITSKGGLVALIFGGEDVSFAKSFAAVYAFAPPLPRMPFESLVALLVLPIPRSIFTIKPFGASAAFTQQMSPVRWEWTKSETLVTGYGDVYWQFGTVGAFLTVFILGFLWLRFCLLATRSSRHMMVLWAPLMTWWMFIFVRGDLFNVGLLLWPAMTMILLHRCVGHMVRHRHSMMKTSAALALTATHHRLTRNRERGAAKQLTSPIWSPRREI